MGFLFLVACPDSEPRPLPPEGETEVAEMKTDRRWVAWMAALMFAVILIATPRDGAAGPHGPYVMPDEPPGPVFGEPDQPPGSPGLATRNLLLLRSLRIRLVWTGNSLRPVVVLHTLSKRSLPTTLRSSRQ